MRQDFECELNTEICTGCDLCGDKFGYNRKGHMRPTDRNGRARVGTSVRGGRKGRRCMCMQRYIHSTCIPRSLTVSVLVWEGREDLTVALVLLRTYSWLLAR